MGHTKNEIMKASSSSGIHDLCMTIYHNGSYLYSFLIKLVLVGFEPTITEFSSDTLTDWAIRP